MKDLALAEGGPVGGQSKPCLCANELAAAGVFAGFGEAAPAQLEQGRHGTLSCLIRQPDKAVGQRTVMAE